LKALFHQSAFGARIIATTATTIEIMPAIVPIPATAPDDSPLPPAEGLLLSVVEIGLALPGEIVSVVDIGCCKVCELDDERAGEGVAVSWLVARKR
jgi:hypothetical protein